VKVGGGVDSQAGFTLRANGPVIVADVGIETRFRPPALLLDHGVVSGLTVIIAGRDRPFGVLGAHTTRRRTFTPEDVHFLQSAANVIALTFQRDESERERARLLRAEQDARREAERANRAKDQFLAVLSHELRTPLTPVLASISAMLDGVTPVPEEFGAILEMIRRNVELEARLIDDLLDVTRIVRGKLVLNREVVDLHRLIRQTAEICRGEIHAGKIRLYMELAASASHVQGDPARLQQVLWNLIKNAVKFTPGGDPFRSGPATKETRRGLWWRSPTPASASAPRRSPGSSTPSSKGSPRRPGGSEGSASAWPSAGA
jgi:signal transduction histidine kinase